MGDNEFKEETSEEVVECEETMPENVDVDPDVVDSKILLVDEKVRVMVDSSLFDVIGDEGKDVENSKVKGVEV